MLVRVAPWGGAQRDRVQGMGELVPAWLEDNLGRVVRIERQARWRPVWFADVERDGEVLELCVRGDRTDFPGIYPLEHEMLVEQLLHVPTVRARELAANGQQDDYVSALETLYGITVEQPATAAQAECPVDHLGFETA